MNPLRQLPAVNTILDLPALVEVRRTAPPQAVVGAIRAELGELRSRIRAGEELNGLLELAPLADRIITRIALDRQPRLRPVINATGIVLHTNLGRSPLHESAADAARAAAAGYLNLELDLATGKRSSRQAAIRDGIRRITGAAAATAVNNCAAATVIVLRAVAAGKDVIVSRGQLVEIGGGFRIPEVMAVSGATLREVGTTNITRLADYERAISPTTAALMRVHCSNFRIRGFTKSVGIAELAVLGKKHGLTVIDDAGSGQALDLSAFGLGGEPVVAEGIAAGADVVLFSGDKLLGGPQAGLIAGSESVIRRIEADPLMRAFRLDKMTLAALEATLGLYRDPAAALKSIPTLCMLTTPVAELMSRSIAFADRIRGLAGVASVEVREDRTYAGGGTLPDLPIPTVVIAVKARKDETALSTRLRTGDPAVLGRVKDGAVLFDLRAVFESQEDGLVAALAAAVNEGS